MIIMKMIAVQL